MSKEETIKWLESLKAEIGKSEHRTLWHYAEAIDMAIEALKTEPLTEGRYEKAMQKLQEMPKYLNNVKAKQIKKKSTNTVQGEWIKHEGKWVDFDFYPTKYECNQCHYCVDEGYDSIFCPNCGAKMKVR